MKRDNQTAVAIYIVGALLVISVGCLAVAVITKDAGPAWGAVGATIGALATALNAPSGIGGVISASKGVAPPTDPAQGPVDSKPE